MSSPFQLFRKHQKGMMVALVLLAMFAFILLDPLMKMFAGRHEGEVTAAPVVTIGKDGAKLSRREISDLRNRRRIANEFIQQAMYESRPPESFPLGKVNAQMGMEQLGNAIYTEQFRYLDANPNRISDNDVVVGYLLRKEAERMGVAISNEAITKYIENLTHGNLSKRKLDNILTGFQQNPPLSELRLYDILRDELMSRLAYSQMFPTVLPAPEKYWDYFKRLHESQKIEAIVVPAADFVSKIKDPGDATLKAFFEEHKKKPDSEAMSEETPPVSFYQPDRLSIQDLRLKFSDVEASVAKSKPITDKDIAEYYEKNKDLYEERPSMIGPGTDQPFNPKDPLNPLITPGTTIKLPDGPLLLPLTPGTTQPPATKGPELKSPDPKAPATKATDAKTPAKVESPADPKASVDSKAPAKAPADQPETKGTDAKGTEKAPEKAKTPVITPPARKQSRVSRRSRTVLTAFADTPPKKPEVPAKVDSKPAEKAAAKPAEKAPEKPAEKPTTPAASKDVPPATPPVKADPAAKPPVTTEKAKPVPATADQPATKPAVPGVPGKAPAAGELPPLPAKKYRPLDAALKEEIRKNILKERTFEEIQKISDQVMTDLRRAYNRLDQQFQLLRLRDEDRTKLLAAAKAEMEKIAKKFNLTFGETPLLTGLEFSELPALGKATEVTSSATQRPISLIQRLYTSVETFVPGQAEDQTTSDQFYYWKVEFKAEHVPTFDEPGVRKQVLEAWKLKQAEPLAKKRAEELVAILSKSNKPAAETLGKTTVTGEPDSKQIAIVDVPSFTWLEVPSAHSGMQQRQKPQVQLKLISQVEKGGTAFRELVYYQLKPGQWGSAPAFDNSAYYVVKLVSRHEPKEEELMQTPLFASPELVTWLGYSPYEQLSMMDTNALRRQFFKQLEKNYGVKWSEKDKDGSNAEPASDDSDS